jgi:sporulation-control protein
MTVVFRRILQAFGVGGPSVETILVSADCRPGGFLEGTVQVHGGGEDPIDIEYVAIALTTRLGGDAEYRSGQEFQRQRLTGSFRLDPGQTLEIPFRFDVPWETPITELFGQHLHGMTMGLATELEIARTVDQSDLDAVAVHPVPAQERVLDALLRLGFRFTRADVELGRLPGETQGLPFRQAISFLPPAAFAQGMRELTLTFLPSPDRLRVVLETDGRDPFDAFDVDHAAVEQVDWVTWVGDRLRDAAQRGGRAL